MKYKVSLCCFIFFAAFLHAADLSVDSRFSSVYTDDSGSSFSYSGKTELTIPTGNDTFSFSAGYQGITSNLEIINGTAHNAVASANVLSGSKQFSWGIALGGIPKSVNFSFDDQKASLSNAFWCVGLTGFSFLSDKDFSVSTKAFFGTETSSPSNLYIYEGCLEMPALFGALAFVEFPSDIHSTVLYSGSTLSLQNEAGKPNGNGKLSVFYGSIGKSWHIKNTAEHNISGNAGFMYTGGFGSATPEPSENYMFYPFSYLHANGGFSCYFVSISGKYEFTFNNLKLALEAETFINIYSNINYFYKYTFKKNILYDGSIHRGNDNFSFSNGDFILLANLDASYKTTIVKTAAVKVTAEFFISKDIVLPVMTEKTKLLFRSKNNQQPSNVKELDLQFNFKTILLSGLSLGVKISL